VTAVRALLANPTNAPDDVAVASGVCAETLGKYLPEVRGRAATASRHPAGPSGTGPSGLHKYLPAPAGPGTPVPAADA
jgi:hypothetical protein